MRYWAQQAVALCDDIDDESFNAPREVLLEAIEEMGADRRIVLIGGSGCGKSTLLAGMIGNPILGRVSATAPFLRWRYMDSGADNTNARFLPEPNLFGLEVIDAAGCERDEVSEAVAPLLPGADVVVAVVDARKLEASPVWAMIQNIPAESGVECLVAVTHGDTLGAAQEVTLTDSVRRICHAQIGRVLPVYLINSNNPALAGEFGSRIVETMENSTGGLRAAIRKVMKCGSDLLYKQGSVLKARDAVARTDSGFLAGIEQEIDNFLARQMQGVRNCVLNYAAAAQRTMPRLIRHLRRDLGYFLSPVVFLRLECYGPATENLYYRLVLDDISEQQEELDKQFIISCGGHWRSVRPRMKQTLQCEIGDFPANELESDLGQLRERLQSSLYAPFRYLKLRSAFVVLFKRQVEWMRFFVSSVCLLVCVAGILGLLSFDGLALMALLAAFVMWMLGSLIHFLVVKKICSWVRTSAEPLHENLHEQMGELVQDMIVSRVSAYRRLYTAPRQRVADYEVSLAPLQQRQSEIFRQLRSAAPHV